MASRRIQTFGRKPVVGDLVLTKGDVKDEDVCDDQDDVVLDENNNQKPLNDNSEITILDENNIHNYELKDVVLPIYGSKTVIPNDSILSSLIE